MVTRTSRTAKTFTEEDLIRLPYNGKRYELEEGKLIEMAPGGGEHGQIALKLGVYLGIYLLQNKGLGTIFAAETGYRPEPGTVRGPDVSFVSMERLAKSPKGYIELSPDLAVEVVSPGDTTSEVTTKVNQYLALGVRLVWVVWPERAEIIVYRQGKHGTLLQGEDELDGEDVLPGFKVNIRDIFTGY